MLEVKDLTKRYGDVTAVAGVSFKAEKGEILGFLGPNGAGKTTTMRILTGYLPPTSGTAVVAGYDVATQAAEVRRRIGYLPESPPVYEDMTVGAYLNFVAKLKQVAGRDRRAAVDKAMEQVSVTDRRKKLIRTLSKGYKQRVGLAQALLGDPEVLVLDEPTIGLDPVQIREIRELIRSLEGSHTVILSTHILPEVQMTCSRAVIIHQGRIVAADALGQLYEDAETERRLRVRVTGTDDATGVLGKVPGGREGKKAAVGYVLRTDPSDDVAVGVGRAVDEAGWRLAELMPIEQTLEDIFIRYTSTDAPAAEPKEA